MTNTSKNNSFTNKSLLILQFNVNGLKNHAHELEAVLYNRRIDNAIITENHFTNLSKIYILGFNLIHTNHPNNTANGGAAICVRSSIVFQTLPSFSQDYFQACSILI